MTTATVTTLDSGYETPQTESLSSEIIPEGYTWQLRTGSLLRNLEAASSRARSTVFIGYQSYEIEPWGETPTKPSLMTTFQRSFNAPVPWFSCESNEELFDHIILNNEACSPFIWQWYEQVNRASLGYVKRITELRGYAEDDGIQVNDASVSDFWSFVGSLPLGNAARLFLMDNGNLRAVWKDASSNHVGIHFLGQQRAEYVIFRSRGGSEDVSRVAGIDTLTGIKRQIRVFNLSSLVSV